MTYLVDANILIEPTKPRPDAKVVTWLSANEGDFVVDSVILGEIAIGILVLLGQRALLALPSISAYCRALPEREAKALPGLAGHCRTLPTILP